jgi:hypothetical protein
MTASSRSPVVADSPYRAEVGAYLLVGVHGDIPAAGDHLIEVQSIPSGPVDPALQPERDLSAADLSRTDLHVQVLARLQALHQRPLESRHLPVFAGRQRHEVESPATPPIQPPRLVRGVERARSVDVVGSRHC